MAITVLKENSRDTEHKWRTRNSLLGVFDSGRDRRKEPRLSTSGSVQVVHSDLKEPINGMLHDISSSGAKIRLMPTEYEDRYSFSEKENALKEGDEVIIKNPTLSDIIHRNITAEVVGIVKYRQSCFIRLKFSTSTKEETENIWLIMRSLKRQNKALTAEEKEEIGLNDAQKAFNL